MMVLGLVSLVFAAFMLYRRRDIKRLFAYSSIEHMGIITFAFGMGGPLANFAGLLHMTMHSLTKSAIFFAVGHIAQVKGTQRIADIGGLSVDPSGAGGRASRSASSPSPGCRRSACSPREFMLVSSTFARQPLLAVVLVFGLLVAFGALMLRLQDMLFGEPSGPVGHGQGVLCAAVRASRPRADRRALAARAGRALVPRRRGAAGMTAMSEHLATLLAELHAGRRPPAVAALRGRRTTPGTTIGAGAGRRASGDLLGLWGEHGAGPSGAARRAPPAPCVVSIARRATATFPRSAAITRRRSGSSARSAISTATRRSARRTGGRGSITAPGACARRSARARRRRCAIRRPTNSCR